MYLNWQDGTMYILDTLKWYSVPKVVDYLHELRKFIIETPAKYGASYLPRLEELEESQIEPVTADASGSIELVNIPASKNQRFPYEDCYLCEAIGDWGVKLDKLALAANIMVNPNRLERKYPDFDTAGDVEHYVIVLINQLLHMIHDKVSFVNQQSFEERYDLKWSDNETVRSEAEEEDEEEDEEVQRKENKPTEKDYVIKTNDTENCNDLTNINNSDNDNNNTSANTSSSQANNNADNSQ